MTETRRVAAPAAVPKRPSADFRRIPPSQLEYKGEKVLAEHMNPENVDTHWGGGTHHEETRPLR